MHILTASGVAFGLFALLAAHERRFTAMFAWLALTLAIDAIDGPLARWFRVKEVLPHWSGDILDLVVDYLTYVVVPIYALILSGLIDAPLSLIAGASATVISALYFADGRMKTDDMFFRGFPAAWNIVVFYLFLFQPPSLAGFAIVLALCALTFIPAPFLHPIRVTKLRFFTIGLLVLWMMLAITALAYDLSPPWPVGAGLLVLAVYFFGAGIFRSRNA